MSEKLKIVKKEHLKLIHEIVRTHREDPLVESVALVGSISRGVADYRDIDLLVLHNSTDTKITNTYKELYSKKNPYILDDSLRFMIDESFEVGLAYKQKKDFVTRIRTVLEGKDLERVVRTWAVGGFVPEILLSDVSRAIVLLDKNQTFECLLEELTPYSSIFATELINFLAEEINEKLPYLKGDNAFMRHLASVDIQVAALRLLYALHEEFFPGFKRAQEMVIHWNVKDKKTLDDIIAFQIPAILDVLSQLVERATLEKQ